MRVNDMYKYKYVLQASTKHTTRVFERENLPRFQSWYFDWCAHTHKRSITIHSECHHSDLIHMNISKAPSRLHLYHITLPCTLSRHCILTHTCKLTYLEWKCHTDKISHNKTYKTHVWIELVKITLKLCCPFHKFFYCLEFSIFHGISLHYSNVASMTFFSKVSWKQWI